MEKKLKKLILKKEEIALLTDEQMVEIRGGNNSNFLACLEMLGDAMERNSDGPYIFECLDDWYQSPWGSLEILYGGCLITD